MYYAITFKRWIADYEPAIEGTMSQDQIEAFANSPATFSLLSSDLTTAEEFARTFEDCETEQHKGLGELVSIAATSDKEAEKLPALESLIRLRRIAKAV